MVLGAKKANHGSGLKISLKQMLQTLAIALAHVKAGKFIK